MIDIHSHILPGVDDGARTLTDSLDIIQELSRQGVTDIIATPHYITDTIYNSTREQNLRLLEKLRAALDEAGIDVNVFLGNEVFIDINLADLLKRGVVSTLADSEYVLVEFSLNEEYLNYADILGNLMTLGYKVILAHPERYLMAERDYSILENLCEMGVLLQCNTGSFIGQYGKGTEKLAVRLAKEKKIFALGSDIHHARGDNRILKAQKRLHKYYSDAELKRLLVGNPSKIIGVI